MHDAIHDAAHTPEAAQDAIDWVAWLSWHYDRDYARLGAHMAELLHATRGTRWEGAPARHLLAEVLRVAQRNGLTQEDLAPLVTRLCQSLSGGLLSGEDVAELVDTHIRHLQGREEEAP
jgi:hypothetical protein